MFKIFTRISILAFLIVTLSCSNEVDINADWADIPVVYCVLDPAANVQYVKISKAFLGEGDAMEMAKIADSIHYAYKMNVQIEKWRNGIKLATYNLDTITMPDTKDGVFASDKNVVYYFNTLKGSANEIDQTSTYKLIIENPKTGKRIESETNIVRGISLDKPYLSVKNATISFFSKGKYASDFYFEWKSVPNALIYDCKLRFYYYEYNSNNPGAGNVQRYFDFNVGEERSSNLIGGEQLVTKFNAESFFSVLASSLEKDPSITRTAGIIGDNANQINVIITSAAEDLSSYIDVNKPSSSLVQEKPQYSNITNAVGLFSSRYTKTFQNIALNLESSNELKTGKYTSVLNFK